MHTHILVSMFVRHVRSPEPFKTKTCPFHHFAGAHILSIERSMMRFLHLNLPPHTVTHTRASVRSTCRIYLFSRTRIDGHQAFLVSVPVGDGFAALPPLRVSSATTTTLCRLRCTLSMRTYTHVLTKEFISYQWRRQRLVQA